MLLGGLSCMRACATVPTDYCTFATQPPYNSNDIDTMSEPMVSWTLEMETNIKRDCRKSGWLPG